MREIPILFSAPMVRAILAGTKTQTRRALRVQPDDEATVVCEAFNPTVIDKFGEEQPGPEIFGAWWADGEQGLRCPHGRPGDQLVVRETFFAWGRWETRYSAKKGRDEWHFVDMTLECGKAYRYDTDGDGLWPMPGRRSLAGTTPGWWKRPAIFMPRAASRITLAITDVRVERLQDINDNDAQAEGCEPRQPLKASGIVIPGQWRLGYRDLWNEINGPGSWDANPWTWAITFGRLP